MTQEPPSSLSDIPGDSEIPRDEKPDEKFEENS